MKIYVLAGLLALFSASCVTNSNKGGQSVEIKPSDIGGIYAEAPKSYDDETGYELPNTKPSVVNYNYNYRTVSLDTTTGVQLNECINATLIPKSKSNDKHYNQLGIKIELSEGARMKLMNLSLSNPYLELYLVLGSNAVATFRVEGTLASGDIAFFSEDRETDEQITNFFEKN